MAVNDLRHVPYVRTKEDGSADPQHLNEIFRDIYASLHLLEGRRGPSTIRDSQTVDGAHSIRTKDLDTLTLPDVVSDSAHVYVDPTKNLLMASVAGEPYVPMQMATGAAVERITTITVTNTETVIDWDDTTSLFLDTSYFDYNSTDSAINILRPGTYRFEYNLTLRRQSAGSGSGDIHVRPQIRDPGGAFVNHNRGAARATIEGPVESWLHISKSWFEVITSPDEIPRDIRLRIFEDASSSGGTIRVDATKRPSFVVTLFRPTVAL